MARPGVTYQDIVTAANELKGHGKSVTIENVRSFLGTGSIGTINKYLRQWKDIQASTGKIASKENLPEELVSLMKGLWEGVLTQSLQQFEPVEANYQREISELKTELEKYQSNNQRWQKLFNQWQQEKTQLSNEKLTSEQALEFTHKENHSLQVKQDAFIQQLQEKHERIDELHRLHKQAQENLEHYRESSREQRLLDQQQFEREKQQLQFEIKSIAEQLMLRKNQFIELEKNNQNLQQSYDYLEKEHAKSCKQLDIASNELVEAKQQANENSLVIEHLKNQLQESKTLLAELQTNTVDVQINNKLLSSQLEESRKFIQSIESQNKLLAQDKLILTQEKSQLEGQLKQIQQMMSARKI